MLLGVFIAMAVAAWFDVPLLPIFLLGAIMQTGVAYGLTQNTALLRSGFGLLIVVAAQYLVLPMLMSSGVDLPISPSVFEILACSVGIIGLFTATIVGIFGVRTSNPPVEH